MEVTKNYALNKPEQDDFYDVDDFNKNADIIDEELYALENPVYEDAKTLETLKSGEKIVTAFGKIAKAITDFISHISDEVVHITADERMKWNAKQDASTAITTGNIGNQSVKHATTADTAAYANNALQLRYFSTDWKSRIGNVYGILGSDGRVWINAGGDDGGFPNSAVQYANSAGSATDQTARDSAANANNNANGRLSTSGGTISGNLSVGGTLTMMNKDIYLNNHSIFSASILQGNNVLRLRTPNNVAVENVAGNANMDLYCAYLHCVSVTNTSYREAKENIVEASEETARKILDVPIFKFDYRPGFGDGKKNVVGTIVDEVQNIIPEAVNIPEDWDEDEFNELLGDVGNKDTPGVDYVAFVPYLIAMVQLQQKEIDELKQKVTALENKN